MARYVTLKDSNGEALYPQIKADSIADGTIAPSKLMAPYWKVVSIVDGTNVWTIPAGYRYYRVVMRCSAPVPSSASQIFLACDNKGGSAYTTGIMSHSSTSVTPFQTSWGTSDNRIGTFSPTTLASSNLNPIAKFELARTSADATTLSGYYTCTGGGADWTSQGKLEFTVSSADSFNIFFRRDNSGITNFHGYVEALVEG